MAATVLLLISSGIAYGQNLTMEQEWQTLVYQRDSGQISQAQLDAAASRFAYKYRSKAGNPALNEAYRTLNARDPKVYGNFQQIKIRGAVDSKVLAPLAVIAGATGLAGAAMKAEASEVRPTVESGLAADGTQKTADTLSARPIVQSSKGAERFGASVKKQDQRR